MLILASASPRRSELLSQVGISFRVIESSAEEIQAEEIVPEELVAENARLKAQAVADSSGSAEPVLGADTVVAYAGKILGKPKDNADAVKMLTMLSGKEHAVYTGIALIANGKCWTDVQKTVVKFDNLTAECIDAYVATGEPADKAGAYAIQGKAALFVDCINGSYSNVVGLPLAAVRKLCQKAGIQV